MDFGLRSVRGRLPFDATQAQTPSRTSEECQMSFLAVAALSSVGVFAALSAYAQDATRVNVDAVALKDPSRVTCAYLYHEGTVIRRPLCKTAQEWYADRLRTRQDITDLQLRKLEIGR